ncbi:MAG TPA: C40 family peptidase [Gemmatimonadaceae bacterium]|nr:C40 family peptidase [Gemmatimonadaceae bacterium]
MELAVVVSAVAPLHAEPRVSSPQVSQRLAGERVEVLDWESEWLLVRGSDGYDGWMHSGYLQPTHHAEMPGDARVSLGCIVRGADGVVRPLPLGAALASDDELVDGEVVRADELERLFPRDAAAIADTARRYFVGTSYQWGGVTPWGADCSGFSQTIFALHGVTLPRDAWQQALEGADAGSDPITLLPADLLFFSDRPDQKITHVGISLGSAEMAHLALGRGGYRVEKLDDPADQYVQKLKERFLFGRRYL